MAIVAYVGLPGAGKSYSVLANVVIPALKAGRKIITNVPLKLDALRALGCTGEVVQLPEDTTAAGIAADAVGGAVYVLDELYRFWPAGLMQNKVPVAEREFFAMHRHRTDGSHSTEIVLVTQDLSQIAGFIRPLVEETFRMVKLTAFGLRNRFRVDVYQGAVTGPKPPSSQRLREMYGKYNPKVYACYQSQTQAVDGITGEEKKIDSRGSLLRSPILYLVVVAVPFVIWCCSTVYRFFHPTAHPSPAVEPAKAEQREAAAGPRTGDPVHPVQAESKIWRLAGWIEAGTRVYAIVESTLGSRRIPPGNCNLDGLGNRSCVVDGQIVTAWSGAPVQPIVNQMFSKVAEAKPQ